MNDCGHVRLPSGQWAYADDECCIDGTWYGYCTSENCYGVCDYKGLCGCKGCDSDKCCAQDAEGNLKEPVPPRIPKPVPPIGGYSGSTDADRLGPPPKPARVNFDTLAAADPFMPSIDTITLDQKRFGARQAISRELLADMRFDDSEGFLRDTLIATLEARIFGKQIDRGTETEEVHVPATWFDAFLVETRIGRFLQRWRKPRSRTIKLTVNWTADVLLPEWTTRLPKTMGPVTVLIDSYKRFDLGL